jgi:hypothetical protein
MEKQMYRIIAGLVLASVAVPAAANETVNLSFECAAPAVTAAGEEPNLHGTWDFLMDVGATPNFGLLSIGFVGTDYGGALALSMTAPVVISKATLTGDNVKLVVASPQGDVVLNGTLAAKGTRMCGTVTYIDGSIYPMVAQKRPSTYQSQPRSQRTPAR